MIVTLSCLAEMASMTPSSTGLYHWVGEFAPKPVQKYLSYLVGWSSIMAWLTGAAALNFLAGTMLQSIAVLWLPTYHFENWHSTLIIIGIGFLCTLLNTVGNKALPFLELITFFVHFFGIWAVLIPLWVLAPKSSAKDVFVTFKDSSGWGNVGLACLIGQAGPLFSLLRTEGGTQIGT
jgi:choline transport protein